uniref:CSON005820 protein n=1 Tax=Culicoides sonorensis TaxID=179676 RepID=A0A336MXK6_CULSO
MFQFKYYVTVAIKCYKCSVMPPSDNKELTKNGAQSLLCSKFDESDDFITDCPYSTMCMKRIFKLQLPRGQPIETITRGCANQKYTEQVYRNGSWHKEFTVEEPYEEGCKEDQDGSTYCHCKGKLCNSATTQADTVGYHTDAMAVIFVFNIMRYLRHVEY